MTSFREIFFFLQPQYRSVYLSWQQPPCKLMKRQVCTTSQIGGVYFQDRAGTGRSSAATNQLTSLNCSAERQWLTAAEDLSHFIWKQKIAFILQKVELLKI